nr:hypothetical protein [Tanacetum cinerariifolium]
YSVNPSLNIQNELSYHQLFINELIQQKIQNEYAQAFSAIAITLDLPTVEPKDSLRIGDEHLDTILETKSNKFIKSSVENLVLNPSESEDLSDNPHHFNAESDLIESLLNHDFSIISSSSKIDSLLDEFIGELIFLKTNPQGKFNSKNSDAAIESFSPSPIPIENSDSFMEEIDLSFTPDDSMPPGIEEDDHDSEGICLSLKNFLAIIPFHFLKMSHFILIFLHPLVFLRNHRMMIRES